MNALSFLLEYLPLETSLKMFFQNDETPPHFGHRFTDYLNQSYGNREIFNVAPKLWLLRYLDLILLDFFLSGLMNQITNNSGIPVTNYE